MSVCCSGLHITATGAVDREFVNMYWVRVSINFMKLIKLEPDWVKLAPKWTPLGPQGIPLAPPGTPLGAGPGLGTSRALKCDACA